MDRMGELRSFISDLGSAPTLGEMERRGLKDKGINGPTGAHVIEEIHTPYNFAYITATTGTTAFQNLVGVTHREIPGRIQAANRLFQLTSIQKGCRMLITYPPLVSVFSKDALDSFEVKTEFLLRSERSAFVLAVCEYKPDVIVGESSFLKAALTDARQMGMLDLFPKGVTFLAAGTPLDLDFPALAEAMVQGKVHDLYGCQEFGFLTVDGIPLREDITLVNWEGDYFDLLAGGLPTGDCFTVSDKGHMCNPLGRIITYSRRRKEDDCQVVIKQTSANGLETLHRLVKTILRIKARIIQIDPNVVLGADVTKLAVFNQTGEEQLIEGPVKTELFDSLLCAQMDYQSNSKRDPVWLKGR